MSRLARAQHETAAADLDALLLTPGSELRYLTGYHAHATERLTCLIVPASGPAILLVPELEEPAARASGAGEHAQIRAWAEGEDPLVLVADIVGAARRVAVGNRAWAEQVLALRAVLPDAEQSLAGPILRPLRIRKDSDEVDALRRAGQAIDRVHARMGEWLRAGRTESEVGRDIAEAIVAEGHVEVSFVIVGSGPNGASPHHAVSDRVIEAGDPVVVDIGGVTADGYCSDSTRTYSVGEPPADFRAYYDVLQTAQDAGVAAVRPGVSAEQVDAAARELITAAGYGEYFIHRTGHGIGLDGHEEPWIIAGNTEPLQPGMAFSVEPGIYLPDKHGARIEDIVVCTEDGVERLNTTTRDLVVL